MRPAGNHLWRASQVLNLLTFGSPREMFCSRVHRRRWHWVERFIDRRLYFFHRHKRHCEACWRWDRENGAYD